MANLYLYNHFSSDGHTEDDICIMSIDDTGNKVSSTSKRLEREIIGAGNYVRSIRMD